MSAQRRYRRTPLLILAVSLVLTVVSAIAVRVSTRAREDARFHNASQAARDRVWSRLDVYVALLRSTRAFLDATPGLVSVQEFHRYAQRLNLENTYPGIQGIGFSERLTLAPGTGKPILRTPGAEHLHLWPETPRTEYHAVTLLEPLNDRNLAALGYDMFTDATRREAMMRARDGAAPAMTGAVTLVQEIHGPKQPGFLIYIPVYSGDGTPATVAERRQKLVGFVYAPFRAGDLFNHLFGSEQEPRVAVQVYAGPISPENLLYNGLTQPVSAHARVGIEQLSIGGQVLTLRVVALPSFVAITSPGLPVGLALIGLLVSFAMYALALGQARAREEADEDRSVAHSLVRLGMTFASELDPDKLIQRMVDEATRLIGAQFGGYFHNVTDSAGHFTLFSLSGASREDFAGMPHLRKTPLFEPTFAGEGPIRYDDVTKSPLFGKNPPYHGLPRHHLPVRSYLAMPVRSRSGAVIGAMMFGHPEVGRFTEQHARQVESLAAQAAIALDNARLYQEAQEAIRLRDEFLSVASHELKTPLTPLTLKLEHLMRRLRNAPADGALNEQTRDTLVVAQRQVQRLSRLVSDLLDVTRITAGRMRIEHTEVDLASLVREVALRFEPQAQRVQSELTFDDGMPLRGRWDPERLDQVLTILVDNAIKYGAGQPIEIATRMTDSGCAELSVTDHGIGIAEEAIPHIFDRFVRAVSERHYGGLGLGLYIAQRIVEAHGGTMRVRSTPGVETVFTVELPLVPPKPLGPDAAAAAFRHDA